MEDTIAQLLDAIHSGKRSFQSSGSSSESVEIFQSTHVIPLQYAFERGFLEQLPVFHKQSMTGTRLCDHVSVRGRLSCSGVEFVTIRSQRNDLI